MDAAVNLKEQPDIKTLLYVLGSSGLKKEQQEVETLVDYLESMGNQFSQMIGELQAMREELEKMQDKGIRATVSRVLEGAENKTQEIWGKSFHDREKPDPVCEKCPGSLSGKGCQCLAESGLCHENPAGAVCRERHDAP